MSAALFSIDRTAPNLLEIDIHGAMDSVSMEVTLDMLVKEMDGMDHGGILMRAEGMEWPSLGAIGVELRHFGQLMAMIKKVDRIAFLTDRSVFKTVAAIESALVPNLEIKSFEPDQETEARSWLAARD